MRVTRLTRNGINICIVVIFFLAIYYLTTQPDLKGPKKLRGDDSEEYKKLKKESHLYYDLVEDSDLLNPVKRAYYDEGVVEVKDVAVPEKDPTAQSDMVIVVVAQASIGIELVRIFYVIK